MRPRAERNRGRGGDRSIFGGGRVVLAAATVLLVLTATGCGLPSFFFLAPPLESRSPEPPRFFFDHNPENDSEEFDGYDIWYKLYPLGIDGFDATAAASADRSVIVRDPPIAGTSQLQNRNFNRIVSFRQGDTIFDRLAPTLPLNPGSTRLTFELDFGPGDFPSVVPSTADILLRQFPQNSTPEYRLRRRNRADVAIPSETAPGAYFDSFWDKTRYRSQETGQIDPYSDDITFEIPSDYDTDPTPLLIILYAITVGTDPVNFNRVYSEPVQIQGNSVQNGIEIEPR